MRFRIGLPVLALAAACASPSGRTANREPADGAALLARMHDRYAGRWFRTLTFVQRTTQRRPDGTVQVSTWCESQRGSRLRIDVGDPSAGNGALYPATAGWRRGSGCSIRARRCRRRNTPTGA